MGSVDSAGQTSMSDLLVLEGCKRCGSFIEHSPLNCPKSCHFGMKPAEIATVCGMTYAQLVISEEFVMHAKTQNAYWDLVSCVLCRAQRG